MDKTDNDLHELLIKWVKLAVKNSKYKVIVASQRGVTPTDAHSTVKISDRTAVGMMKVTRVYSDDELTVDLHQSGLVACNVRIGFLSAKDGNGNPHELCRKLLFFMNTNEHQNFIYGSNVAILTSGSMAEVDDAEPDGFMKRAFIDLDLQCSMEYVETVNVIDDVEININNE